MAGERTPRDDPVPALVWPAKDERRLLARFYLALGLSRALYLVAPFEFAYLFLVMERPEWSVLPLVVLSGTSLVMQLPAGVLADRRGRKVTVLVGGALAALVSRMLISGRRAAEAGGRVDLPEVGPET
jgi:MFS family permease